MSPAENASPHPTASSIEKEREEVEEISLDKCCVCAYEFGGTEVSAPQYAAHLRTNHSSAHYRHLAKQLEARRIGLGLCDGCGEAWPINIGGAIRSHICKRRTQSEREGSDEREIDADDDDDVDEDEEGPGFDNRSWPEGVPYPPAGIEHPFDYAAGGGLQKKIPKVCIANFAELVESCTKNLNDAIEGGTGEEKARALDRYLLIPRSLVKGKRGGKKGFGSMNNRTKRFFFGGS